MNAPAQAPSKERVAELITGYRALAASPFISPEAASLYQDTLSVLRTIHEPRPARCEACLGDGQIEYGHPNAPDPDRVETCKECNGTGNAQCPQCVEACEMLGRAGIADGDLIDKVGDAIEAMERAAQPPGVLPFLQDARDCVKKAIDGDSFQLAAAAYKLDEALKALGATPTKEVKP
jgi:hypothetical protein